jgi:hypothetical protein
MLVREVGPRARVLFDSVLYICRITRSRSFDDVRVRQVSEGPADGKTIWRVITTHTRLTRKSDAKESHERR